MFPLYALELWVDCDRHNREVEGTYRTYAWSFLFMIQGGSIWDYLDRCGLSIGLMPMNSSRFILNLDFKQEVLTNKPEMYYDPHTRKFVIKNSVGVALPNKPPGFDPYQTFNMPASYRKDK